MSPSTNTLKDLGLPADRVFRDLDMALLQQWINELQSDERGLFVIDDLVGDIRRNSKALLKNLRNRRHLGKGTSWWISSQKWNSLELAIRTSLSQVFIFRTDNMKERQALANELSNWDFEKFNALLEYAWQQPYDFLYVDLTKPVNKRFHRNFNVINIQ